MKENILLIHFGKLSGLPPALAILDSFTSIEGYDLTVLSSEFDPETDEYYSKKGVKFIHCFDRILSEHSIWRKFQIIWYDYVFRKTLKRVLREKEYKYKWILHEVTAIRVAGILKPPFIMTTYELNDKRPFLTKRLIPMARKATVNVVCEYNRAHIMKVLYGLCDIPLVIPNKPVNHPRIKNIVSNTAVDNVHEKIVLYQGQMYANERNLEALCEAVDGMVGFKLVLMGSRNTYTEMLCKKYPSVLHIDFIKAPYHLSVTSHAYIGFVSYSSDSLNTMYCAPNKIWEYSGFGVPMIANNIPGLKYTVEVNGAGKCVDTDSVQELQKAICEIDCDYIRYSNNALSFYESCDVRSLLFNVIDCYNERIKSL